jgi:hypothetical protein
MFGNDELTLVPSEDPAALERGIRDLMANPSMAGTRAEAAVGSLARRFDQGVWLEAHIALYARLTPAQTDQK